MDATEDGYTDHELFSLSSMKVSLQFDLSLFNAVLIFGKRFRDFFCCYFNLAFWVGL